MEVLDETATFEAFVPYLLHNKPVVFRGHALRWPCSISWHAAGDETCERCRKSKLATVAIVQSCGNAEVSVTECGAEQGYGAQASLRMPIGTFLEQLPDRRTWYAKDFHIFREVSSSSSALLPEDEMLLADDWLNWWWTRCLKTGDDYRFAYIGGADTSTPMHHDVMASYSWSANIHGRKHWLLVSPAETHLLFKQQATANMPPAEFLLQSDLPADIQEGHYDPNVYSGVAKAHPIEFIQKEGDVLFVPSGWYHQVRNLGRDCVCDQGITVSVNHNWMNGFNIYQVWRFLLKELIAVRAELRFMLDDGTFASPLEWSKECDKMLRANSAISVEDFLGLIFSRLQFYCDCLAALQIHVSRPIDSVLAGLVRGCDLQPQDIALVKSLVQTRVVECPSDEHQPANYEFSLSRTMEDNLANLAPVSTQTGMQELAGSSVSALSFELLQIHRILSEMNSSEAFLQHITAVFQPADASGDETTTTTTTRRGEQLCRVGLDWIQTVIAAVEQQTN